ncbi:MAG TPA: hypothetical protein VIK91_02505 [Nannocystis sp.]
MPPASALLARLRDDPRHLTALARLLVDEVLLTPAREFVCPARLTPAVAAGLRAVAADSGHAAWVEARLRESLARIRPRPAPLRARLPESLVPVLRAVVRRPFTPSRALVRAVVDQATTRDLSRTILHTTLLDFARRIGSILPDASKIPGAGVTSKLFGVARGVASVVGLDAQLEDRVRQFVDGAVGRVIDMIVDRASDPRFSGEAAAFRSDVLAAVLDLPESALHAELVKLDPALVAADLQAALVALAGWDRLEAEIEAALVAATEAVGDATVGDLLAGSGEVEAWRAPLEAELRHHLGRLVGGAGFAAWLAALCEETLPEDKGSSDMSEESSGTPAR